VVAGRVVACAVSGAVVAVSGFTWYTYRDLTDGMTTSDALRTVQQGAPPHLDRSCDPTYGRTARNPGGGGGSGFVGHQGQNTLDASQALAFVRQRHNLRSGDFDRTHRQQAFIASVTTKLKQEGLFSDLGKLQGLLDAVKQDVVIDNGWNVLDFAQQATNLTGGKVEFNTLQEERNATLPDDGDVNIVDVAKIRRTVRQQIGVEADTAAAATAAPTAAPRQLPCR
jgi:anionic cell wall polymer biosynthesis LytR-Cps2A-Psr (LCP) family protein